jgi:hypothetical protein
MADASLFQAAQLCFWVWHRVTELARQKPGWIYAARHLHKSNFAPVAARGALSHLQTPQNTITSSGAARWFLSPFKYIREEYFSITSARSKNIFIWRINLAPCDTLGESANKKSSTHTPCLPATLSFYPSACVYVCVVCEISLVLALSAPKSSQHHAYMFLAKAGQVCS